LDPHLVSSRLPPNSENWNRSRAVPLVLTTPDPPNDALTCPLPLAACGFLQNRAEAPEAQLNFDLRVGFQDAIPLVDG
jgi:hypothetical protein